MFGRFWPPCTCASCLGIYSSSVGLWRRAAAGLFHHATVQYTSAAGGIETSASLMRIYPTPSGSTLEHLPASCEAAATTQIHIRDTKPKAEPRSPLPAHFPCTIVRPHLQLGSVEVAIPGLQCGPSCICMPCFACFELLHLGFSLQASPLLGQYCASPGWEASKAGPASTSGACA